MFDSRINQYNVSPKLDNSGNPRSLRENPDALRYFASSEKAYFKFVICKQGDLSEILNLQEKFGILSSHIYLMPEGTTIRELNQKQLFTVKMCLEYGFNYSDRLHIYLFGDKRGT